MQPDINIGNVGMVLGFNGCPVGIGASAAILGHPARSLAGPSRFAAETGDELKAG
jgi:2-oxo-3-hexenedioate decarboxylase